MYLYCAKLFVCIDFVSENYFFTFFSRKRIVKSCEDCYGHMQAR